MFNTPGLAIGRWVIIPNGFYNASFIGGGEYFFLYNESLGFFNFKAFVIIIIIAYKTPAIGFQIFVSGCIVTDAGKAVG